MNIFVLDIRPDAAARFHCDKHVVKMILESAQLLSTTWHVEQSWDVRSRKVPDLAGYKYEHEIATEPGGTEYGKVYGPTHRNHPCAVWVRQSRANYEWLHELATALLAEYRHRYRKEHACTPIINTLSRVPWALPEVRRTPFALCMPEEYKVQGDPVKSYRAYYRGAKQDILKYTNRQRPGWL